MHSKQGNQLLEISRKSCKHIELLQHGGTVLQNSEQACKQFEEDDDYFDDGNGLFDDDQQDQLAPPAPHQQQQQSIISSNQVASEPYTYWYHSVPYPEESHALTILYKNRLFEVRISMQDIAVHTLLDALNVALIDPEKYSGPTGRTIDVDSEDYKEIAKLKWQTYMESRFSSRKPKPLPASNNNNDEMYDDELLNSMITPHVMSERISCNMASFNSTNLSLQETYVLFQAICVDEQTGLAYMFGGAIHSFPRKVSKLFVAIDLERLCIIETAEIDDIVPLEGHSMVKRGDKLYVFGGNTTGSLFLNDLFEIDISEFEEYCLELRRRDEQGLGTDDLVMPTPKARQITATNHNIVTNRAYHTAEYLPKYDVMVSYAGKVRKGPDAPMLNEILIYHFKRNEFQIIQSENILNPSISTSTLPRAHVCHSTRVYGYEKHYFNANYKFASGLENCYQMGVYGGCKSTEYDDDATHDPHLYIFSFIPHGQHKNPTALNSSSSYLLDVYITKILIVERVSSTYTNVTWVPQSSSFYFLGSYSAQSRNKLSIFTMNFSDTGTIERQFQHRLVPLLNAKHFTDISLEFSAN
ncbi:hypothetical protein C9374_002553 [Naegleria lovaniensis]|uniref:Uncharacterized protein n=1 Tax=Naegleria lovaniensis TaxID=51637 RepID=A0AA88GNV3_NAELO|nr:uncharacterized protein C9374_002553 [Naegleria lovaniensis]KAG2386107.1 hypothetical protein C9374_002553 [Naegleria lovaniensis]